MASALDTSVAGLAETLQGAAGAEITYLIGSLSAAMTAVRGRTDWEVISANGVGETVRTVDWLIVAADWHALWAQMPARGHRVRETGLDGKTRIYEVGSPSNQPCYRNADPSGVMLRIHSHLVEEHA